MARNLKLLLVENVESLGIVGDVVNVRTGYARNFLLPRKLATQPDEKLIAQLAGKRADAQKMLAEKRKEREALSARLQGVAITLIRSCNDQGILYASITQQDVAAELNKAGYGVTPRDIRIAQTIKRVDSFELHIKLDSDLDATIKLKIEADRKLESDRPSDDRHEKAEGKKEDGAEAKEGEAGEAKAEDKGHEKAHDKGDRGGDRGDRPRKPRPDRKDGDAPAAPKSTMGSFTEERKIVKWSSGKSGSSAAAAADSKADKNAAAKAAAAAKKAAKPAAE